MERRYGKYLVRGVTAFSLKKGQYQYRVTTGVTAFSLKRGQYQYRVTTGVTVFSLKKVSMSVPPLTVFQIGARKRSVSVLSVFESVCQYLSQYVSVDQYFRLRNVTFRS